MITILVTIGIFVISIVLIVLGFIALLRQKTYIDSATNQPTEVEIPIFGKIKTNYPALVFVLLGAALAVYGFQKTVSPDKVPWTITGSFAAPSDYDKPIEWENSVLSFLPPEQEASITNKGAFTINVRIEKGKSFEEAFQTLKLSLPDITGTIVPQSEMEAYNAGKQSLLRIVTPNTRDYKPAVVQHY